ncbi:MAG: NAD(P)/FAD-dependent oxidoreductase [Betaproteobacteria bacterium]|nr:NAD(P)/FAD-dependent oxidoreductase [Betaproteobacteria bacterium]
MSRTPERIAIIGAGPMGLAAAFQLVREGHIPVIFEADDRIGGMTASFDCDGMEIERYYHFHCTSDRAFLKMLAELGLADKMRWTETKMAYWFRGRLQAWGNPGALLKFRGLGLVAKFRYGLHAFHCVRRNDWRELNFLEASAWVKQWVGKEAYEILWRKLFDLKFHEYANTLSAAWIWSRIRRIGRSRYDLFREKLGCLEGGSQTWLREIESYIRERGGEFRLGTPVSRVLIEDGAIKGIRTGKRESQEEDSEENFEPFGKVISTIPIPCVPRLMPGLPRDLLEKFRAQKNIAVVCVIARLKRQLSENFWLNINDDEMDIPGLVEVSNLRPLPEHVVYVPFYMPGKHPKYKDADEIFTDRVRYYLRRINPALRDEDFLGLHVHRYRYAQPVCPPRHLDNLPPVALPIKGLWVADTSYYYPEDRGVSESFNFGKQIAKAVAAAP